MSDIKLLTATLNGKRIAFSSETEFTVQTSKRADSKSAYETRYTFKGDIGRAVFHYNCINLGNGYRKRLIMDGKVLNRQAS
jgi:hypothetical protein